jgi:hypothetical protein
MTPNNPQTDESSGGEVFAQVNQPRVVVNPSTPQISERVEFTTQMRDILPTYSAYNAIAFRGNILTNDTFRRQFVDDVFADAMKDPQVAQTFADPAILQDKRNKFEANLLSNLSRESMTGQDTRSFVVQRERDRFLPPANATTPITRRATVDQSQLSPYFRALGIQESSSDPTAKNPVTSATGMFQFVNATWNDLVDRYGETHGLTRDGRTDPVQSMKAVELFNQDIANVFNSRGVATNDKNMYMGHFLGPSGGARFISALEKNPDDLATKHADEQSVAKNKTIFYVDGDESKPRTVAQMYEYQTRRFSSDTTWNSTPTQAVTPERTERVPSSALPNRLPVTPAQVLQFASKNTEAYQRLGIVDSQGNPIYQGPRLERALQERLATDENLINQVLEDRYDLFTNAMAKSHNADFLNTSDVDAVSRAWVMYSQFGEEGLTHYINLEQHYRPGRRDSEQDSRVRSALDFMRFARKEGKTPVDHMDSWTRNGSVYAEYIPQMRGMETLTNIPLDTNNFTQYFYSTDNPETAIQNLLSVVTPERGVFGRVASFFSVSEDTPDVIASDVYTGFRSEARNAFLFDVFKTAKEGTGPFTTEDLLRTVQANAQMQEVDGKQLWFFNYDQLPDHAKIAVDAIRTDNTTFRNSFQVDDYGNMVFEPGRAARLAEQARPWAGSWTKEVPVYDNAGNVIGTEEVLDTSILGQLVNARDVRVYKIGQFGANYIINPTLRATHGIFSKIGAEDLASDLENSNFWRSMRDYSDARIDQDIRGFLPTASSVAVDMGGYIAGSVAIAAAITKTGGAAAPYLLPQLYAGASAAHKAVKLGQMAMIAQRATTTTRAGAVSEKLIRGLKSKEAWTAIGRFELGAAGMELIGGRDMSVFNGGAFDDIVTYVSNGTINLDTDRKYALSNRTGQFFMDAGFGFGLGVLFDGTWALTKYGANVLRATRGKTSRGVAYNAAIKDFEQVAKPEFSPDWRRFWYNATNNLDEIPMGDVMDSMQNLYRGRATMLTSLNQSTVSDLATRFFHETDEVFSSIRPELENILRHFDTTLGAGKATDDEIIKRVDKIYNESLVDFVNNAHNLLKGGPEGTANKFVLAFADALEQQLPIVRRVGYPSPDGTERMSMTLAEATALRNQRPNTVIKRLGGEGFMDEFGVYEIDSGNWTVRVSQGLRERAIKTTADDIAMRTLRSRHNITDELTADQMRELTDLTEQANRVAGQAFVKDGKVGYVVDMLDGEYTVRFADGTEVKVQNAFMDDMVEGRTNYLFNDDGTVLFRDDFTPREISSHNKSLDDQIREAAERQENYERSRENLVTNLREQANSADPEQRLRARAGLRGLGEEVTEPLALLPNRTMYDTEAFPAGRPLDEATSARESLVRRYRLQLDSPVEAERIEARDILRGMGEDVQPEARFFLEADNLQAERARIEAEFIPLRLPQRGVETQRQLEVSQRAARIAEAREQKRRLVQKIQTELVNEMDSAVRGVPVERKPLELQMVERPKDQNPVYRVVGPEGVLFFQNRGGLTYEVNFNNLEPGVPWRVANEQPVGKTPKEILRYAENKIYDYLPSVVSSNATQVKDKMKTLRMLGVEPERIRESSLASIVDEMGRVAPGNDAEIEIMTKKFRTPKQKLDAEAKLEADRARVVEEYKARENLYREAMREMEGIIDETTDQAIKRGKKAADTAKNVSKIKTSTKTNRGC